MLPETDFIRKKVSPVTIIRRALKEFTCQAKSSYCLQLPHENHHDNQTHIRDAWPLQFISGTAP